MTFGQEESINKMQTWSAKEDLGNGIYCYRDVIKPEFDIINILEKNLGAIDSENVFKWRPAYVGYQQLIPSYRDCVDFKFKKEDIQHIDTEESLIFQDMWQKVYDAQRVAVDDYRKDFNIMDLKYWEAFNFIKYGPGQHFQEHHDHGYSYNCTVSLVAYVNDDYEGGELYFRLQKMNIKPKAGDLYVFPSNFMYPHRAMPVHSGTKYSIVTMLDYNKKFHTREMYVEDTE
jgi:hypothetical protein